MKNKLKDFYFEKEYIIKKVIKISILVLTMITILTLIIIYFNEQEFRRWVDMNILRKDIKTSDVASIDLDTNKNNQIYCYGSNICILNDKNLKVYGSSGQEITNISVEINSAMFDSNGNYLAIAEKNGQNICTIYDKTFLWKQHIDGEILQISMNPNGYVAVVTTDTTYKSIITVLDQNGKIVLKNYLSSSRVIDVTISHDNKYVAFSELDTSSALIKSTIKIISVDKALENPEEAIIYTYTADDSKMVLNINYQEKGLLTCIFDNTIEAIFQNNVEKKLDIEKNITFVSCDLKDDIVYIREEDTGIFNSKSSVNIINISNNHKNVYNIEEVIKEIYTYKDIIGINVGTEMYFINTKGMLIKKYSSKQEITNVLLSDNLAIIIYKDRIHIIEL